MVNCREEVFAGVQERHQPSSGLFGEHQRPAASRYLKVLDLVNDPVRQGVFGLFGGLSGEEGHDVIERFELRALLDNVGHLLVTRMDRL